MYTVQQVVAGARIVDKYCEKEKAHPEIEGKKRNKNRGSAVPLLEEGYPS